MGSGASTIRNCRELDSALKPNVPEQDLELAYADYEILSKQYGTSDELSSIMLIKYKHIISENVDVIGIKGHLKDFLEKLQIANNLTESNLTTNADIIEEPNVDRQLGMNSSVIKSGTTVQLTNVPIPTVNQNISKSDSTASHEKHEKRPSLTNKSRLLDFESLSSNKSDYQKLKLIAATSSSTSSARRMRSASEDDFSRMGQSKRITSATDSHSLNTASGDVCNDDSKAPLAQKSTDSAHAHPIDLSNGVDRQLVKAETGPHIMAMHSGVGVNRRVSYESSVQRVHRLATMPTIYEPTLPTHSSSSTLLKQPLSSDLLVEDDLSCLLCHVFFQTTAQKERHIKHSETHAKQMEELKKQRKLIGLTMAEDSMNKEQLAKKRELELAMAKKAEQSKWNIIRETTFRYSSHNKEQTISGGLLYSGTKFFWRDRDDVEIQMFTHIKQKTLEIVAIDIDLGIECNRMYLSLTNIMRMIDEKKLRLSFDNDFLSSRYETAKRQALCTFVLSRLQMDCSHNKKKLTFVPSATDDFSAIDNQALVLPGPPAGLVPCAIIGGKKAVLSRTPSKDFDESLVKLEAERRQLGEVVEVAAKYAMSIETKT